MYLWQNQVSGLVTNLGGMFILLVVESFGRWTPLACQTLKSIARCTTLRNGLQERVAYRNLCEQLSVLLWTFNTRMVLRHLSTLPVDPPLGHPLTSIFAYLLFIIIIYYSLLLVSGFDGIQSEGFHCIAII